MLSMRLVFSEEYVLPEFQRIKDMKELRRLENVFLRKAYLKHHLRIQTFCKPASQEFVYNRVKATME